MGRTSLGLTERTWPLISSLIFDTSWRMPETVTCVFMANSVWKGMISDSQVKTIERTLKT